MLERIKSLLFSSAEPLPEAGAETDAIATAAVALLIEAAVMDGNFDPAERTTIANLLGKRFELSADAVERLIEEGERAVANSVELYGVTRVLKDGLDHAGRLQIMEMLWQVALADGQVHDYEANLVRRVAGLLHVPDKEAGQARKNALERLDFGSEPA